MVCLNVPRRASLIAQVPAAALDPCLAPPEGGGGATAVAALLAGAPEHLAGPGQLDAFLRRTALALPTRRHGGAGCAALAAAAWRALSSPPALLLSCLSAATRT